jgi:hypothetical protein
MPWLTFPTVLIHLVIWDHNSLVSNYTFDPQQCLPDMIWDEQSFTFLFHEIVFNVGAMLLYGCKLLCVILTLVCLASSQNSTTGMVFKTLYYSTLSKDESWNSLFPPLETEERNKNRVSNLLQKELDVMCITWLFVYIPFMDVYYMRPQLHDTGFVSERRQWTICIID